MVKSKTLIVAFVAILSVTMALSLTNASVGDPFRKITSQLDAILALLQDEVIPKLDPRGVPKTGQTECYRPGDDGDWQMGRPWPEPRFILNGDGTVTDAMTGLMWTRDVQQIPGTMTWYQAVDACNNLIFGDYDDWRLPNVKELLSLANYARYGPALPDGHPFDNMPGYPADFWSSTTLAIKEIDVFHVSITNGTTNHVNKAWQRYVWAVRGGYRY